MQYHFASDELMGVKINTAASSRAIRQYMLRVSLNQLWKCGGHKSYFGFRDIVRAYWDDIQRLTSHLFGVQNRQRLE